MLSFDSIESSVCGHELTLPMQAPVARYMKDEDNQRSEDAKESPRVEKQIVTEVDIERSENAKESLRIEKQVVTEVETESDEELELMHRLNKLKGAVYLPWPLELRFRVGGKKIVKKHENSNLKFSAIVVIHKWPI